MQVQMRVGRAARLGGIGLAHSSVASIESPTEQGLFKIVGTVAQSPHDQKHKRGAKSSDVGVGRLGTKKRKFPNAQPFRERRRRSQVSRQTSLATVLRTFSNGENEREARPLITEINRWCPTVLRAATLVIKGDLPDGAHQKKPGAALKPTAAATTPSSSSDRAPRTFHMQFCTAVTLSTVPGNGIGGTGK